MTTPPTTTAATARADGRPGRTLAVRLDSIGDVLVTGPAVRALAAASGGLDLLAGPRGRAAAELLPGVDEVITWHCPWIDLDGPAVRRDDVDALVDRLTGRYHRAVVFTSFHQSPLPTALLLRMAGIDWVGAISVDFPGRLLDLRHHVADDIPETERALSLAAAAGATLPAGDDGRLAVRHPLPRVDVPPGRYVVVHPGTSAPARAWPVERHAETAHALGALGWHVVATGSSAEAPLTAAVAEAAGARGHDWGGRSTLAELLAVVDGAAAVVSANTGTAHVAAAVGTPVVSLFAPTVPAVRWAPYGVPTVLLGDQGAACAGSRAVHCPVRGHPCLSQVTAADAVRAVGELVGSPIVEEEVAS